MEFPATCHWVQVNVVGRRCQGLVPLEYVQPSNTTVQAPLKHLFAAMTTQMQRDPKRTNRPVPKSQNPAHPLPPHWSMPLPKSQKPAVPFASPGACLCPSHRTEPIPFPSLGAWPCTSSKTRPIPLLSVA